MSYFAFVNFGFLIVVGLLFAWERVSRRAEVPPSAAAGGLEDLALTDWRRSLRLLRTRLRETEQELATTAEQNRRLVSEVERMEIQLRDQSLLIRSLQFADKTPAGARDDARVKRLRALLLKELHPDYAAQDSVDRALRDAVFKTLWPKIEEIVSG